MGRSNYRQDAVLVRELVRTNFKLRYQGSALGYAWAIIKPFLMFTILYLVFAKVLRFGDTIPHYPVYLLAGTMLWNFFTECTGQGIRSIEQHGDLIRKINFPKYIIVLANTATALINLFINLVILAIFAIFSGVAPTFSWLLIFPLILELYIFALGISFFLSAVNVKFRDVVSIWEVLTQAMFYAVPIIYPVKMAADVNIVATKILLLNPVAQTIQDVREVLITAESLTTWEVVGAAGGVLSLCIVILVLLFGVVYFERRAKYFAEEV